MSEVLPLFPRAGEAAGAPGLPTGSPLDLAELHGLLSRAYGIINVTLERLRESRHLLQHAAVQQIQDTSAKLHEVTNATETAATDIMDGLDRVLGMIDRLEEGAPIGDLSAEMRDEIFGVMGHLQFQDITTQQLQFAASLLQDMEQGLLEFSELFDLRGTARPAAGAEEGSEKPPTFDPAATVHNALERQALVDALLTGSASR